MFLICRFPVSFSVQNTSYQNQKESVNMWFPRWIKNTPRIGHGSDELSLPTPQPEPASVPVIEKAVPPFIQGLKEVHDSLPIDAICSDVVLRRYLLSVRWPDIESLLDALLQSKRATPDHSAVNIHSYFRTAGSPPSVCIYRLIQMLETTENPPFSVVSDAAALASSLKAAYSISNLKKES